MSDLALIERARAFGDTLAIRQGARDLTYRELLSDSANVAAKLLEFNKDLNENRIALLCSNGQEFAISQWGVWRAGGVCVPLSSSAIASELEYAISDCKPIKLLAQQKHVESIKEICDRLGVPIVLVEDAVFGPSVPLPQIEATRRAMILYTSGTTNEPKGVVTTHANIEAQIRSLVEAWEWSSNDRVPLFLPLHHIHGIINVLSCGLWSGAVVESFPAFEMPLILSRIADKEYSLFMAVPTIYVKLIQELQTADLSQRQAWVNGFSAMRLMVSGSAALPASVHTQWTDLTGQELLERYGMTEIGMALSNPLQGQRRPGSVGIPLPNVEIRLKEESGRIILLEDEPGEIQVRGPAVFCEYWQKPDATEASFDDGWFRTGDMAVLENGYYRIMGRLSVDIIKSGGYKLSALEIEDVLMQHPSVSQCAVVGVPDATWGEAVAVVVVLCDKQQIELEALRSWCRDRMSPYKIPKLLKVVDALPRNAMGKVVKTEIRQLFLQSD